ncbi:ancient ubiquitous protein 1-like [Anneissia japonica]|uniref:ancient ubiquitous protein 1-like n=1 Tax=Anneissia japonica TaxID=1529436 RepID=UPI0014255ACD|nr:ancient ubiquitous protein 1-like [Anneissia japonica]
MTSSTVEDISNLFSKSRFPSGLKAYFLVPYFPIGLLLGTIRIFIGLHTFLISCILPKSSSIRAYVLRVFSLVLGLCVTQEGLEDCDRNVRVVVANHVSTLDHAAIDLILPSVIPSVWNLPSVLTWLLGFREMGAKQGRDTLIQTVKQHCLTHQLPILSFPEGAVTNGRHGLLKYSSWSFSLDQPVQPVVVTARRPFFAVSLEVLGSRWWQDIWWFFFVPVTVIHLKFLPVVHKEESESVEDFARKVQTIMAKKLSILATIHTSADKVAYAKRMLFQHPSGARLTASPSPVASSTSSTHLRMAKQVKEVLMDVPIHVILQDIAETNSVDLTISNILEKKVTYTPETNPPSCSEATVSSTSKLPPIVPPGSAKYAAAEFSRNSNERMRSFEERKSALLDNARRRYKEKHGIM